jgi:hypothetical protein
LGPGDSRQIVVTTLHPEPRQVDSGQPGAKSPFAGDDDLHLRGTHGMLIKIRIVKRESLARSHSSAPKAMKPPVWTIAAEE